MSAIIEVHVAGQFSRFPAGRFKVDGPHSGERFREEFLLASLQSGATVKVFLDNVLGYGSSFLEEAFGGLVRLHGFSQNRLRELLQLVSVDDSLIAEIWQYIAEESDRLSSDK